VLLSLILIPIVASAQEAEARAQSQSAAPSKAQPAAEQPAIQQAAGPAVTGIIRNPEASPIPGAIVRITNTDTKKSWVSWTEESGKFEFPALPPGRYHLEASQLGFAASSLDVELPVVPSGPIPMVLQVATLAQLTPPPPNSATEKQSPENAAAAGNRSSANATAPAAIGGNAGGKPRNGNSTEGNGGRQPLPPGVSNALNQGMGTAPGRGGFQQTDLTGEVAAQADETTTPQNNNNAGPQLSAALSTSGAASADSFLLQGTVGQGSAFSGPVGLAGLNVGGPEGPGGPGVPGGPGGPGVQGGPGGAGGGRQHFGGSGGGGGALFGGGGGPGGGQGVGGPFGGGGGGRFLRQQVNLIRFGFYDRYENSAFDARPYSITGVQSPKVGHYDNRFGANIGGPLKIPHIYNGSDLLLRELSARKRTDRSEHFFDSADARRAQWLILPRECQSANAVRSIQRDEHAISHSHRHKLRKRRGTANWPNQ